MGNLRKLALLALIAYGLIVTGVNFHSHPQVKDPFKPDCKLCQVSQTSVEQATSSYISPDLPDFGFSDFVTVVYCGAPFDRRLSSRAPPLS